MEQKITLTFRPTEIKELIEKKYGVKIISMDFTEKTKKDLKIEAIVKQ